MISKKTIAIIPARSGSKSIRDKNIKILVDKPLIAWSIDSCLKSKMISKIYVSTDSAKYAEIAKKFGPVDILFRSKKLSSDHSTDYEMIDHAIKNIDLKYDFIAHIRPTTPLRKIRDLDTAIKVFNKSDCNALRSVHEMSETSYKSVEIIDGKLKSLKNLKLNMDELNAPRQNFSKTYSPNGVIDIYKKKFIINKRLLFGKKVKAYKTSFSPEIDNIEDFKYVEFLCQKKK
jgi:CMP-N-acetylneuraminic acid synthetase